MIIGNFLFALMMRHWLASEAVIIAYGLKNQKKLANHPCSSDKTANVCCLLWSYYYPLLEDGILHYP